MPGLTIYFMLKTLVEFWWLFLLFIIGLYLLIEHIGEKIKDKFNNEDNNN